LAEFAAAVWDVSSAQLKPSRIGLALSGYLDMWIGLLNQGRQKSFLLIWDFRFRI
jgi:hypothetical protein